MPKRKPNRIEDYDYSRNGTYFVTICVKDMKQILGQIVDENGSPIVGAPIGRPKIELSHIGKIIEEAICNIPEKYEDVSVDIYTIMPNHIHMIILIDRGRGRAVRAPTISQIIGQMKGYVTKKLGYSIWQKLFWDHVIRNGKAYEKIWYYIDENPLKWELDEYYDKI